MKEIWGIFLAITFTLFTPFTSAQTMLTFKQFADDNNLEETTKVLQQQAKEFPKNANAQFQLGLSLSETGQHKKAQKQYEKAFGLDPKMADAYYHHGLSFVARIDDVGMFKKASYAKSMRKSWEQAVKIDPTHVDARESLFGFYINAPGIAGGSTKKAKLQAEALTQFNPARGNMLMGTLFQSEKQPDKAIQYYKEALKHKPDEPALYLNIVTSSITMDRHQFVFETVNSGIMVADKMSDLEHLQKLSYQLGKLAAVTGQYIDEGKSSLISLIQDEQTHVATLPSLAWMHYRLGLIYQHEQDKEKASTQFKQSKLSNKKQDKRLEKLLKDVI